MSLSSSQDEEPLSEMLAHISTGLTSSPFAQAPSAAAAAPAPSNIAGEYLAASLGGGMPDPKSVAIVNMSDENLKKFCFGFIGLSKNKFCIKAKGECQSHTGGGAHLSSKFEPKVEQCYICTNQLGTAAWTSLSVHMDSIRKKK